MDTKNVLFLIGGLVVGAAGGIFGTKKYFDNKYQKMYEEDRAYLEDYYIERKSYIDDEDVTEDAVNPPMEGDSKPGGRMSAEERAEIKEKLNRNWEGTTNYAGMYREKNGYTDRELAEGTAHPLDQGEPGEEDPNDQPSLCASCSKYAPVNRYCLEYECGVEEVNTCSAWENGTIDSPEEMAFDEHQKNKDRPPKIISDEAFSELDAHIETEVLYFYAYDEMLCDENEEPIEEPERLVGDCLDKYGFRDNNERLIFVMNYSLDTAYEIQKVDASWTDTH